jgi:hypothetical protein
MKMMRLNAQIGIFAPLPRVLKASLGYDDYEVCRIQFSGTPAPGIRHY